MCAKKAEMIQNEQTEKKQRKFKWNSTKQQKYRLESGDQI